MILWKWDTRVGAEVLGVWPREVKMGNKTLMQLYSQHLYSAKADIVSMYVGSLNVLSMWTGSIHNYFLSVLLQQDEDPENYSEIISDTLYYLIPYIESESYTAILPSIYQRFVEYPNADLEQRRAILYSNELNRTILTILQEEGVYYKDELKIWLEDSLKKNIFNFDIAIERLSKNGYIKVTSVKEIEGTYLFLMKDLAILRAPPLDFVQRRDRADDSELYDKIYRKIFDYFKFYQPSPRDNNQLLTIVSQTDYYIIIDFLRKTHATTGSLKKLILHGVSGVEELINDLQNLDIVDIETNINGEVIYFLKSNVILESMRPKFMMRRIYDMMRQNKKNPLLLREYIKLLKENFIEEKAREKEGEKQTGLELNSPTTNLEDIIV